MDLRQISLRDLPPQLAHIPDPPDYLWMRGSMHNDQRYLTVVGSRDVSPYGVRACELLISGLAGYPITIVSGLALGTDAVAHRAALAAGLPTIAFPGSGLFDHVIAPRTNAPLASDILAAGGALLSEYDPDATALPSRFPERNRLMVGIADAVLMIEAGERSGTLISARLAGEYDRELLCIPHRLDDPHGNGPHRFLRLGATLATESLHLLEALRLAP